MLLSEAIARIQRGLGYRTDQADNIKLALEETRQALELEPGRTLPFFLRVTEPLTLALGASTIALPSGFIRPYYTEPPYYIGDEDAIVPLNWFDFPTLLDLYNASDPGAPLGISLRDKASPLEIRPIADAAYSLIWSYYRQSEPLTGNDPDLNKWLIYAPQALWAEAGLRMALDVRDAEATTKFKVFREEAQIGAFREEIIRESYFEGPIQMGVNN